MDVEDIRARMRERDYNQADLASLLGIDPTAVSKRLTGKRPFKHAEMVKVEQWLGYEAATPTLNAAEVRIIPIIGQVPAGTMKEAIQQPLGHLPVPASTPKDAIALRVDGDSMDLEIADGGTVIVDPNDKALFPGRLYVVLNGEHESTFKQFELDPARLVPRSTNPAHTTILIGDGQPFSVFGRVTALHRSR
jgi:repressor LexA